MTKRLKCEKCNHEQLGTGVLLCPKCGYVMKEIIESVYKPIKKVIKSEDEINGN